MQVVYDELYEHFIKVVPKAKSYCDPLIAADGVDKSDGMHWYFGVYVVPFIEHIGDNKEVVTMMQIASFIEMVETSGQEDIAGVIEQSVMEALWDRRRDLVYKYWSLWGEYTKAAFDVVGEYIKQI